MISKIKIRNCQSHKDTEINFTRGLNCILASSDVGKSALIRALRWTLFNDNYSKWTTWGEKQSSAEVDLIVSNDTNKLIREKGKGVNRYTIIKNGEEIILNNFGDYPSIVGEIQNFKKLVIDDKKEYNLNVLSQHDNLFLLNESNSIKARAISTLIGINKLDNIIKDTNLKLKQNKSEIERLQKEKTEIQQKIQELDDLQVLEQRLVKINELKELFDRLNVRKQCLNQLFLEFNTFTLKYNIFKQKTKYKIDIEKVNILEKLLNRLKYLIEINKSSENLKNRISLFIKTKKNIDINKINSFFRLNDILQKYLLLFNEIKKNDMQMLNIKQKKEIYLIKSNEIEKDYRIMLKEYKICPICYKNISEEDIDEVLKHAL